MAGKSEYHRDSPTLTDSLEFADYLQALGSIVNRAETPLTVGVFGTWGAGKTSLMKMLNLFGELIDGDIARAREAAEQVTNPAEEDSAAQQLLAIMREVEDPRPARERVAAGLGLGLLGDPRREVLEPGEIEWIEIPAGPFSFEPKRGSSRFPTITASRATP